MYYLVRCLWLFLANRFGHKYFIVLEWVAKTKYQGKGAQHRHIAAWALSFGILDHLKGRTGTAIVSAFVIFRAEIDVQVGSGRLNYINGYVAKDHDAVDVSLGEYVRKDATAPGSPRIGSSARAAPVFPRWR